MEFEKVSSSPLAKVIKEVVTDKRKTGDGFFYLLQCQTGIGKTYESTSFIIEEMLAGIRGEQGPEPKPIIFITDTIDNVFQAYKDLEKRIESLPGTIATAEEVAAMLDQILYIPSNADQLKKAESDLVDSVVTLVDDDRKSVSVPWNKYNSFRSSIPEEEGAGAVLIDELSRRGSAAYRAIVAGIKRHIKRTGSVPAGYKSQFETIIPAMRFSSGEVRVLFMTTAKYLTKVESVPRAINLPRDYPHQILFIDEVDKQNGVIINHLAKNRASGLIKAIRTCYQGFQLHSIEDSRRYGGVLDILSENIQTISDVWNKYRFGTSFDLDSSMTTDQSLSMFMAFGYAQGVSISREKGTKTVAKFNATLNKSVICNSNEKENNFVDLIRDASFAYRQILKSIKNAVFRITKNSEAIDLETGTRTATIDASVSSIVSQYHLSAIQEDISNEIGNISPTSFADSDRWTLLNRNYHLSGFTFNQISREGQSIDTVEFYRYALNMTPTGMVASMVNNGMEVIGISATAGVETVLHNFDIRSLKRLIGPKLATHSPEQAHRVYEYYCSKRDYEGNKVGINVEFFGVQRHRLTKIIEETFGSETAAIHLSKVYGDDAGHRGDSLSQLMLAVEAFIKSPDSRYMLALSSRVVGKQEDELEFIRRIFAQLAGGYGVELHVESVDAKRLRGGAYDTVRSKLSEGAGKVLVLSSYPSMGAGKNPDYESNPDIEPIPVICVGDELEAAGKVRVDIDSIYLDKPTNLFVGMFQENGVPDPSVTKILALNAIMLLQVSNEIDANQSRKLASRILSTKDLKVELDRIRNSCYYKTSDYFLAALKYIEQAVGRMSRTAFKRSQINIFADSQLEGVLCHETRSPDLFTHEYNALVQAGKAQGRSAIADSDNLRNEAINNNLFARKNLEETYRVILSKGRLEAFIKFSLLNDLIEEMIKVRDKRQFGQVPELIRSALNDPRAEGIPELEESLEIARSGSFSDSLVEVLTPVVEPKRSWPVTGHPEA
ncbi:hypothetical protein NX722_23630 [Endozoicomonas gorgoniicola]|uniref:Helicase ATP-binding domain-containing protein n=1 Tax=Endozoicomonas gorgoniicola TaxID=1234144 RepID=A0ABT3N1Q6_9GAMM|nr:hypothetical protein [Endozoicomonas gorgoniicola]MCW7555559.1 hypothetical protein [Endozoicomonas gorgoniicola]